VSDLFYGKTREDWINELERELRVRQRVYGRLVAERRMNSKQRDWRIDTLQDLLNHLKENPTWQPKENPSQSSNGPTTTGTTA
jgi:hypothetical protein